MPDKNSVTIMNIDFLNTTKDAFLQETIQPHIDQGEPCQIVTANPEIVMQTQVDDTYKKSVEQADYVVPDGAGILLAAKWLNNPLQERIAGFDLMQDLLKMADDNGYSCYFLGAEEAVNERAVAEVGRRYPNLTVAGRHHGYFELDDPAVMDDIEASGADLIFVALGLPRQEKWMAGMRQRLSKGVMLGVGGSLDVLAGTAKRAPDIWIKLNLEWLYRLIKQPARFKRVLKVFQFLWQVRRNRR